MTDVVTMEIEVGQPSAAAHGQVSHAIFRTARLHRMLAGQLLRETGLYPGQELLMMQLWDTGPQRQTDLLRVLESDAATITRSVQRLERAGFVRRTRSATDRRATIVEATLASQGLRKRVEETWRRLEELTTGQLTDEQRARSLDVLTKLEQNLIEAVAPEVVASTD